jgi:hypothetical protein
VYVAYGKQRLLEKVSGYNQAAKGQPWLVLVDLDRCSCAVALLQTGIGQRVGTAYTARLIEFIENHWDITQAASHAPSLQRSINCLTRVIQRHRFTLSGTPFSAEASL